MVTLPAANYLNDNARTEGEFKASLEAFLAATKQVPGAGVAELSLTIAAGSITPAGSSGVLVIDTESAAASDDLANIVQTNYPDGSMIMLRNANAARFVVLKHAATGSGQLLLSRNADYVLDDTKKYLLLQRRGTDWIEISRSPGRLEMPVVTKSATFTLAKEHHGCLMRCTGAGMTINVPAAATLGNGFTVSIVNDNSLDNVIVVDLDGTETLNGTGLWNLYRKQGVLFTCDGSNFYSPDGLTKSLIRANNYAATVNISATLAEYQEVSALTGNVTTLDLGNPYIGLRVRIRFVQDATGGRTVVNPSGSKVAGSLASAANQASVLDLTYSSTALRWEGFWTQIPV
jgi:hypothetical protein